MRKRRIKIDRFSDRELMFFIPYIVFIIFSLLSQSFYQLYIYDGTKIVIALCCGMVLFAELWGNKSNIKGLIGLFFCTLLFLLTFMGSRNEQNTVPAMFVFIYGARNIKFRKIAKVTLVVSTIMLAFIILSSKLGVIEDYTVVQYLADGRIRNREFLGFRYALYPSTLLFNMTCLYVYLKNKDIKFKQALLFMILNYLMYSLTDSRLTFVLAEIILILSLLLKRAENWLSTRKRLLNIASFVFVFAFSLSLYLTVSFTPQVPWMNELNVFLGKRLSLGKASIVANGIPIMGQNISWIGMGLDRFGNQSTKAYTYVDSFYIQTIQHYGIIFEIVLLIILTMTMFKVKKSKDLYLFMILGAIAFHFIIDDLQLHFYYNTFWFVIGNALMSNLKNFVNKENFQNGFGKHKAISNSIIR